jgi:uncharacterized protein with ACT and thioredoxin-like domain
MSNILTDKHGNIINHGDVVLIEFEVEGIENSENQCLKTIAEFNANENQVVLVYGKKPIVIEMVHVPSHLLTVVKS